jgi:hypothetical protein
MGGMENLACCTLPENSAPVDRRAGGETREGRRGNRRGREGKEEGKGQEPQESWQIAAPAS